MDHWACCQKCLVSALEGKCMKPQFGGFCFCFCFCFKKRCPDQVSKILVAAVFSLGEMEPGCRMSSRITTYILNSGKLATLETPIEFCLLQALRTDISILVPMPTQSNLSLGRIKESRTRIRDNNASKYSKCLSTFLIPSLVRVGHMITLVSGLQLEVVCHFWARA